MGLIVLALLLSACSCDSPTPLTFFTDVAYAPDGKALVLEATDGLYAASPVGETPVRLSEDHCNAPDFSLSCVRIAGDGQRFAALLGPRDEAGLQVRALHLFLLHDQREGGGPGSAGVVAGAALDATFSPDGREIVWAEAGAEPKTVSLLRQGAEGPEPLVGPLTLGSAPASSALKTAVVTSFGVAFPKKVGEAVEVWFKPFTAEPAYDLGGRLPETCADARFNGCFLKSPDGSSIAWQDRLSGVINVFRAQKQAVLPLGFGYDFSFTRSGGFALRMDDGPPTAYVQNVDTAVVARRVLEARSAELAFDGETLAWLELESSVAQTERLFAGPSRQEGRDRDWGLFRAPPQRPLAGGALGGGQVQHAFTGDGRFLVVAAGVEGVEETQLEALNLDTGERKVLGQVACDACCGAAPQGAMVLCLPAAASGGAGPLDLYDPVSGRKTRVANSVVDVGVSADGRALLALDYPNRKPELVSARPGRDPVRMGGTARFALSPVGATVARVSATGGLEVQELP